MIILILFSAFGNKETAQTLNNSYLPVISGWIGIILGFYFSRELAGIIAEKLQRTEEERDQVIRDANMSATRAIESLIVALKVKEKQGKNGIRR